MTQAVFTRGSTLRHVVVMTGTFAVGLLAMFGVDMIDMFFLTLLGEQQLAAAVGFAGALLYFVVSLSVGLQIGLGALVARAEGGRRRAEAGRYCTSALVFSTALSVVVCVLAWCSLEPLLAFLGARDETLLYATRYARIVLPAMPVMVLGMSAAAAIRALGDARRSMLATLLGSGVNALLDPLFIFAFGWGIEGAAWASVAARFVVLLIAGRALLNVHKLPRRASPLEHLADLGPFLRIAAPAVLTNLATPIGASYVLKSMAQFGDSAVAGAAILGRVSPVAFAVIFSLSAAVGPVIGQNAGAGRYDRVRSTLLNAMLLNGVYVIIMWAVLASLSDVIVLVFSATGVAEELIRFWCHWLVPLFAFNGALFVSNATFNNLHRATWATLANFCKTLLGTVPAVYFGAQWFGARGVLAGELVGAVLFGTLAVAAAFMLVRHLGERHVALRGEHDEVPLPGSAFSSGLARSGQSLVETSPDD